jgi:hypothetical protein
MKLEPRVHMLIIGMLALATHARAQSPNIAPLDSGSSGAALILKGHPGWVLVPGEAIRPDCVHEIPKGAQVEDNGDITETGGLVFLWNGIEPASRGGSDATCAAVGHCRPRKPWRAQRWPSLNAPPAAFFLATIQSDGRACKSGLCSRYPYSWSSGTNTGAGRLPVSQQLFELLVGQGLADGVTLNLVAVLSPQRCQLSLVLDTLGDDLHRITLCEVDDRAHRAQSAGARVTQLCDERLIYLAYRSFQNASRRRAIAE